MTEQKKQKQCENTLLCGTKAFHLHIMFMNREQHQLGVNNKHMTVTVVLKVANFFPRHIRHQQSKATGHG